MKEFLVIRVGDHERPASQEEIDHIEERFRTFCQESDMEETNAFVTHHLVDFELFPRRKPGIFRRIANRWFG
jgi:hypothetical protein